MSPQGSLIRYTLQLADNALIIGHRNSEWTAHGPILEQDIALSNIALDQIGQARYFYQYAADLYNQIAPAEKTGLFQEGALLPGMNDCPGITSGPGETVLSGSTTQVVTEDHLAYLRDSWDFKNCLLAEQANGDWAKTILRQFFISAHQYFLFEKLQDSADAALASIAEKTFKEVAYHLRWSSEWVIRLGDGTEESHTRMQKALDELWQYTGELHDPSPDDQWATESGIGPDLSQLRLKWEEKVNDIFNEARLTSQPLKQVWMQGGGKEGKHTEHLGYLLAEMQFLQRAYPGCEW